MSRPLQPDGRVHGVVAAIAREDGHYLCIRRSRFVPAPRAVCFPGGAVEVGERLEDAVVREVREELGITIEPGNQCWRWDASDKPLTLWGFLARWVSGELKPDPQEIEEVLWLTGDEATHHPEGMPTNRAFVACLREASAGG
jgi:NADH pyrophosphatase NudC (nudix superfamily)